MIGWLRRKPKYKPKIEEAKAALEGSRARRPEVDRLVLELRQRRTQNQFAPSLAAALGATQHRQRGR